MKKNILILLSLITFTAMAQTKGKFEVLDLKDFKLHVYYTNDALNDASYIVEGKNGLISLIHTASIFGNGEMQFNYLDNKTLLAAQRAPQEYRDLVVRVAGYSAFFVELCEDVQNEIISRTMLTKF